MATLVIKNLPDELHAALKARAERHRRSLTKEAVTLIETALAGDYLAQERVTTSREVFPFVDENGVHMIEQLLDLDPLLFFGRVAGAFTRLSSSSLANVTSGAGMVPTMIVD